jgi:hypothetical protein
MKALCCAVGLTIYLTCLLAFVGVYYPVLVVLTILRLLVMDLPVHLMRLISRCGGYGMGAGAWLWEEAGGGRGGAEAVTETVVTVVEPSAPDFTKGKGR